MAAITLKAHYDGRQVCLDEPCDLPADTKLLVVAVPDSEESEESFRKEWFEFSRRAFARAYSDDEPDYSDLIPKEPDSK